VIPVRQANQKLLEVSVVSTSTIAYFGGIATPVLGNLATAYPNHNQLLIQTVITAPSLMMAVFSLLSADITKRFGKKRVFLFACMILLCAGLLPVFLGGLYFLLTVRFIYGIGFGLAYPLIILSIMDFFNEEKRVKLVGMATAIGAASGIFLQLLGGHLGANSWRNAFWGYLLIIVIIAFIFFGYPKDKISVTQPVKKHPSGFHLKKIFMPSIILSIISFFTSVGMWAFFTNIAIVLTEEKISDSRGISILVGIEAAFVFLSGLSFRFGYSAPFVHPERKYLTP